MSGLPQALQRAVEAHLEEALGRPDPIVGSRAVGGGCINPSSRVETARGKVFFLKWNPSSPRGMFAAEADGLEALAQRTEGELRVPEVIGVGEGSGGAGPAWLLLEFIGAGREAGEWGQRLGRGLASLHRPAEEPWGWSRDNFIGSLPQSNGPAEGWGVFWRDRRIGPQLRGARRRGHLEGSRGTVLDELLERIPDLLAGAEPEGPSLLHGDLWGGNVYPDGEGRPVLIDPAVYRGHREVDLAMSELFGFPAGFLPAYREARPVDGAYDRFRRDLYQLYYLLVHVNLFGAGYEAGCLRAARRALGAG